jgi:hypothetical protein
MDTTGGVRYLPIEGLSRYRVGDDGAVQRHYERIGWVPLKLVDRGHGLAVRVRDGSRRRWLMVARVILSTFVGPRDRHWEPLHFPNPDRADCRLSNLRWVPYGEHKIGQIPRRTYPKGEACRNAKLTDEVVLAARDMARAGVTLTELAERFGVSLSGMTGAVRGTRKWRHLPGAVEEPGPLSGERCPSSVLTDSDVRALRRFVYEGASTVEAGRVFGITQASAYVISRGKCRLGAGGPITPPCGRGYRHRPR